MSLGDFDCTECNGGGYRDSGDGELVGCCARPDYTEGATVEMPPIANEEAVADLDGRAL